MKESSEINQPRYDRVLGAANAAARQTPGALVRCAENSEAFVNTVRLTVPPDAELNKIAVHYLHNAAFAADKTTLRTGAGRREHSLRRGHDAALSRLTCASLTALRGKRLAMLAFSRALV